MQLMGQIIIIIASFIISSLSVHASVVLNEVAIQPNQTVELYNTASTSADISSWYIDDAGGTTYFTVPPQTIIAPQSCLIFSSDFNFNKSSTDVVRLFDNTGAPTTSSAKLIEQYSYAKAPDANYSFSKKIDGGTEWQINTSSLGMFNETLFSCIPTPTSTPSPTEPPSPTIAPTPSPTNQPTQVPSSTPSIEYLNIYISEIYPYPQSSENEWVELYNDNEIQVDLNHWYIDDGENTGSAPKSFSLTIEPHMYAVVEISSSLFNNSGDVVRLLNNSKLEKDGMEFGKIAQGKSMGRISFSEDSYCEQESSKNSPNYSCLSAPVLSTPPQSPPITAKTSPKKTPTTKTPLNFNSLSQKIKASINSSSASPIPSEGEVLGIQVKESSPISPTPYFSFVSFSYSLLTIVSVLFKIKNA